CLRIRLEDHTSLYTLLKSVRDTTILAFDNQDVSFEKVVAALAVQRDLSKNPLVQVIFAVHSFSHDFSDVLPGLETVGSEPDPTTRMDFEMHMYKLDEGYEGQLLYNSALYSSSWADLLCTNFIALLESSLANGHLPISELAFPATHVYRSLSRLDLLSNNETAYPRLSTIDDLFRQTAKRYPSTKAVIDTSGVMTYQQLDMASDLIADTLVGLLKDRLQPETTIGIFAERSAINVAAMYGVLKAGLAYVPLD
ncbi:hypothetical protein FISHEDRAFT_19170, partial [Fistulina hepatica ATCC 64428]